VHSRFNVGYSRRNPMVFTNILFMFLAQLFGFLFDLLRVGAEI
jgi:hypothetical protein